MEIKLNIENKEDAKAQLKIIQNEIDALVEVCESQKKMLKENIETISSSKETIVDLTNSTIAMADSLKALHRLLQARKELFVGDEQMQTIMNSLATFVLGSGAIKLGVLSEAKE